jgi:hypothetical protein
MRCLQCGCSRLDTRGMGCALCGGAPAVRWEQCYIDEGTKNKLLAHADELKVFGLTLEEPGEPLRKDAGLVVGAIGLVIQVVETVRPGTFRELVLKLRDLAIPKEQILRLRLDEPENISKVRTSRQRRTPRANPNQRFGKSTALKRNQRSIRAKHLQRLSGPANRL